MSIWAPLIQAGVNLAQDFLDQDDREQTQGHDRETQVLNLQDRERDRLAAMERQELSSQTSLAIADKTLEGTKKRILGDALLQQGQGQEKLGIEAFRAAATTPERFNTAANTLAAILSR